MLDFESYELGETGFEEVSDGFKDIGTVIAVGLGPDARFESLVGKRDCLLDIGGGGSMAAAEGGSVGRAMRVGC